MEIIQERLGVSFLYHELWNPEATDLRMQREAELAM